MIESFADKHTRDLFTTGRSKRLPADVRHRAVRRLEYINYASKLEDLYVPPSNRLHALQGGRQGQYAIRVNDRWRICFRFENGNAYDVELVDYH